MPRTSNTIAGALGSSDPEEIGPFQIIGVLGAGSMGEVYLGTAEGKYVAVKWVRPHLVTAERFRREVRILHQVPDGVAPVVRASDSIASRPWFATDYVPGLTVEEAVLRDGPLAPDVLWLLLAETAAQLSVVHKAGIVHRDLKPANVMLVRDGVMLIDFGIAYAADHVKLTKTGGGFGTQGFAAPEQQATADESDARSADVYSLGALLLCAATGRTPGTVPDLEPVRAVDAALAAVIESCLAANAEARPTAAALLERARAYVLDMDPSWPPEAMELITAREEFLDTPLVKTGTISPDQPFALKKPRVEVAEVAKVPEVVESESAGTGSADSASGEPAGPKGEEPERKGKHKGKDKEKRRRSVLVVPVMSVIVVGGITAFVLVPYVSPAHSATGSLSTASATAAHLTKSTPSLSASVSRSASPSTSAATSAPAITTDTTGRQGASTVTTTSGATSAASVAGPKGPSSDKNYYSGSEVTVSGCAGWIDFNGNADTTGTLWGTLSAGDATCSADVYTTNSTVGGDGTDTLQDKPYTVSGDNPSWYGYVGSYEFTEQICIWNDADSAAKACSAKYTDNSNTVSKD